MAKNANTKPIEAVEVEEEESEGLLFGIMDDIYDIAHDLFPDAVDKFHTKVGDALERVANYMEEIGPSVGGRLRPYLQQGNEFSGWCRRKDHEDDR